MLKLHNISKKLGNFRIKNVNTTVCDGEYFVILGPSGVGKTVLLEIIAGFYQPDQGQVFLDDNDITDQAPEYRKMGFVYQDYMLFPHLTVEANVMFGTSKWFSRQEAIDKMNRVVEALNIKHLLKRSPLTLSGGEQQRVALARALAMEPKLLLLDEPLSSLDPQGKMDLQQELKRIHKEFGPTIIHITHDFNEAMSLAQRLGIMMDGTMAQVGTVKEVFGKPIDLKVASFLGMENIFPGCADGQRFISRGVGFLGRENPDKKVEYVYFPAREVLVGKDNNKGKNQANHFAGKITAIVCNQDAVTLEVDIGITVKSKLSYYEFRELDIACGGTINLTVPSHSVAFL